MLPSRPPFPDEVDQSRAEYQATRYALVTENNRLELLQFMREAYGDENVSHWGAPDVAMNPIASSTKQLVTPGLYGKRPTVRGPEGAGMELVGPDGYLDRAMYWPRSQWVQLLAVGIGICLRRIGVDVVDGKVCVTDRVVPPHHVSVGWDPERPSVPIEIIELRIYPVKTEGRETALPEYCWDHWSIRDREAPFRRVYVARLSGPVHGGQDVTDQVVRLPEGWPAYPWVDDAGPYLPWQTYRVVENDGYWPLDYRRAMHHGTHRAQSYFSFAGHSAMFSQGEHVILTGVDLDTMRGVQREGGPDNLEIVPNAAGNAILQKRASPVLNLRTQPGTITSLQTLPNQAVGEIRVGPGVDLDKAQGWANFYSMTLQIMDGLQPTDATRQSANPTSGAALAISAAGRREFSAQVEPWFRAADLAAIRTFARMLTRAGVATPTEGYTIAYHTIPLSPEEQADLREDLEWSLTHGQLSDVDVYQRRNPGTTDEQAFAAVVAAQVQQAKLKAAVREALAAAGINEEGADASQMPGVPSGRAGSDDRGDASGAAQGQGRADQEPGGAAGSGRPEGGGAGPVGSRARGGVGGEAA